MKLKVTFISLILLLIGSLTGGGPGVYLFNTSAKADNNAPKNKTETYSAVETGPEHALADSMDQLEDEVQDNEERSIKETADEVIAGEEESAEADSTNGTPIDNQEKTKQTAQKMNAKSEQNSDLTTIQKIEAEITLLKGKLNHQQKDSDQKHAPLQIISPSASTTAIAQQNSFYNVPRNRRAEVTNRFGLVQELLLRHGRAYDYRSHTSQELRKILTELDFQAVQ